MIILSPHRYILAQPDTAENEQQFDFFSEVSVFKTALFAYDELSFILLDLPLFAYWFAYSTLALPKSYAACGFEVLGVKLYKRTHSQVTVTEEQA